MIKYKKGSVIILSAAVRITKNLKTEQIKLKSLTSNVTQEVMVKIPIQKLPASDYQDR